LGCQHCRQGAQFPLPPGRSGTTLVSGLSMRLAATLLLVLAASPGWAAFAADPYRGILITEIVIAPVEREGVEIRLHTIIYELIDEVRNAMAGLLSPQVREKLLGHAEVKDVFNVGKQSKVAGCYVMDGTITSRCRARVRRGKEILYQGSVVSLKHFRDDVSIIRENQECGLRLDNFSGFDKGDVIEFYDLEEIKQSL